MNTTKPTVCSTGYLVTKGSLKGVIDMQEKIYKTMSGAGAWNIVLGVAAIVLGIASGILLIVSGAKLLAGKSKILF